MLLTSFASRAERDCGCETTRTRAECLDVKPRQFPFSAEDHRRYFVSKVTKPGDGDVILLIHDHIARIHNDEHDGRMRVLSADNIGAARHFGASTEVSQNTSAY